MIEVLMSLGLYNSNVNQLVMQRIENNYVYEKKYEPFQNSTAEDSFVTINSLEYEAGKMINKLKENNIEVLDYWIPYTSSNEEKVTLFLKCNLPEDIKNDYEKLMDFELHLFTILEDDLKNSNYFHMVGLL